MRTRTWKFAAIMSIVAATFTACDKDDDEYYVADGGTWLSYGNLEKVGNAKQADYAIRRDDGSRLLVVEGNRYRFERGYGRHACLFPVCHSGQRT